MQKDSVYQWLCKRQTYIYFLLSFWKLKFSITSLWGQRLLEKGAVSFCVSAAERQFSLGLSHSHSLLFLPLHVPRRSLVRGSWYPWLSRSCVWGFCFFLQACGTRTVGVKLMCETETAFCADLEDFWSLIKLSIHFWERNNNLEKENPPGDLLSHSLCIWGSCETVNLVRTSPSLLKEK